MRWTAGYRHYNRLIDVFFWILLLGYSRSFLLMIGVLPHLLLADVRAARLNIGVPTLTTQMGMIALIMFRSLREEYAGQQTAATLAKFILLFPLLWVAVFDVIWDRGGGMDWLRAHPGAQIIPGHARLPDPKGSIGVHQFEGVNFTILKVSSYFPLTFAWIYKW